MPRKSYEQFINDYTDRYGGDPATADEMARRSVGHGHIEPEDSYARDAEELDLIDRAPSDDVEETFIRRYTLGSEYRDLADMRREAAAAGQEEVTEAPKTQEERLAATLAARPWEHFKTALGGVAPIPVTERGVEEVMNLGTGAALGAAMGGPFAIAATPFLGDLADTEIPNVLGESRARKARMAKEAAEISDIENARLDRLYYQAMGRTGQGTKQMKKGVSALKHMPEVEPDWIDAEGSREAFEAVRAESDPYLKHKAKKEFKTAMKTERAAFDRGVGVMDEALDDAFEGYRKAEAGKTKMAQLKKIGKVSMKAAYVGPWLLMAEAVELGLAIPMMAAYNYTKITDPAEQIRFFALHGWSKGPRVLEPGDLSPEGLVWLGSHLPQARVLHQEGVLGTPLYESLLTPEGEMIARKEAEATYEAAEQWPAKEQIQSLSRR